MDSKTKELIAIGASVAVNCIPCLEFHIEKAKALGASKKELIFASKIGMQVKAGAAIKTEKHTSSIIKGFEKEDVNDVCNCE